MGHLPDNWIVHLCTRLAWEQALKEGEYRPHSLKTERFIHCSRPDQIAQVANRFFNDEPELVLLWIDIKGLESKIRWETADGQEFPHLYGALNLDAVKAANSYSMTEELKWP